MMQMMMMKDQMVFKQMQERESATMDAVYKVMHHKDEERGKSEARFLDKLKDSEQRGYDAVRREAEMRKEEHLKHSDTLLQMQREGQEREKAIRDQHKLELKEREKREDEERRRREDDAQREKERADKLAKEIKEKEIKIEQEKAARQRKEQELEHQKSKWFNW
ncbi:inner centromere protein-like [Ptychodera flava]|uniref:inner centromere protein-like n=1 Tax=Ptychodera flava TaxID=63121 RepID=UPI00396A1A3C